MSDKSNIEWTDATWNPVTGCSEVSPGCDHCYAKVIAERARGTKAFPNGFDVTLREHKLFDPTKWRKPRRIFVNSMSDLFHVEIPDTYLEAIWRVMLVADHHVYQVLTKRPHRAAEKITALGLPSHRISGSGHRWRISPLQTTASPRSWASRRRSGS